MQLLSLYRQTATHFDPRRSILKEKYISIRDETITERFTLIYIYIYIYIHTYTKQKENKIMIFVIAAE